MPTDGIHAAWPVSGAGVGLLGVATGGGRSGSILPGRVPAYGGICAMVDSFPPQPTNGNTQIADRQSMAHTDVFFPSQNRTTRS